MPELPRSHAPPNSCSRRAEEEELELNQTQNLFLGRLLVHLRNHVLCCVYTTTDSSQFPLVLSLP